MNVRSSIGLIGVFLALFWIFGLMLALDRARVDEAFIMPSLKSAGNVAIDSVVVARKSKGKEAAEYQFARKDDAWTLRQGNQAIKVEAFRLSNLIKEVREAKRDADVNTSGSPADFGLAPPQATVTLSGKVRKPADEKKLDSDEATGPTREWSLYLGNDSPDKKYVYVSTSDNPTKVLAVPRQSLLAVLFKNANDLRSKRLFDFSEPTVQAFSLTEGSTEISAMKSRGGAWLLVKPNLGYADYEGPPLPKESPPGAKAPEGGLKSLINAIAAVRVDSEDDFVPPAVDTLPRNDLVAGKEKLRIQIFSGDDKKPTEETLLVGRQEGEYYYARLATDEGTFKLPRKLLQPIFDALKSPDTLRSRDLTPVSIKEADAATLTVGKDESRFALADSKTWYVTLPGSSQAPANGRNVDAMLDALQGRRDVLAFKDVADADAAKVDAELGFDAPQAAAAVYLNGIEMGKDAKLDDPKLKKDAKPAVSWQFGKTEKDQVWVKRTMADGPAARFTVNKSVLEKIVPREGLLGYLEPSLPKLSVKDIVRMEIDRGGKAVVLERKNDGWILKDAAGDTPADVRKVEELAKRYSDLQVRRWVKKLDAKDDLDALGLKSPALSLTFTVKKDQLQAEAIGRALAQLGGITNGPALVTLGSAWNNLQLGTEKVTLKFGKDAPDKDDAGTLFVQHSKTGRLGLLPSIFATVLRESDYRDRSTILQPQVHLAALLTGAPTQPFAAFLDASPLATGQLGRGDASQVKKLHITIRTPVELRSFAFVRKDKTWVDQSGLKEFQADDEHINTVAELAARLEMNRVVLLAGGPKADQKLTPKDATMVIDAVMTDLRVVTVTVGANFESLGYFTQVSTWPGAVFLLNPDRVQPILRGATYFAKERVAAN